MRLAEMVRVHGNYLEIPKSFQQPLELHQQSVVFLRSPLPSVPFNFIITTIPDRCWTRTLRISCLLGHRPGALHIVCRRLAKLEGNILIMEGSGQVGAGDSWWSAVVDFPGLAHDASTKSNLDEKKTEVINDFLDLYESYEQDQKSSKTKVWPFSNTFAPGGRLLKAQRAYDGLRLVSEPRSDSLADEGSVVSSESRGNDEHRRTHRRSSGEVVSRPRPYPVRVEKMRLSDLAETLSDEDTPLQRTARFSKGRIPFNPSLLRYRQKHGLLLCDTDEKFLRFVETHVPAQIDLPVETQGAEREVGIGVLEVLTGVLHKGQVSIIHTYNYVTERSPHGGDNDIERSQVRFFADTSSEADLEPSVYVDSWVELFEALLTERRPQDKHDLVVDKKAARLRVWYESKFHVFRGGSDGKAVKMGRLQRLLDERERSGVRVMRMAGGLIVILAVGGLILTVPALQGLTTDLTEIPVRELGVGTVGTALGTALAIWFMKWWTGQS